MTATFPSEIDSHVGPFDRFATWASNLAGRAPFFALCVLLVAIWLSSYLILGDVDTWQLIINTATTIITFLMVALLTNAEQRADQAVQHKLNAVALGLAGLMAAEGLDDAAEELRCAIGLEERETSS